MPNGYLKCLSCGHEQAASDKLQAYIVNDNYFDKYAIRKNLLDVFKISVIRKCAKENDFLLDIGSGNGRFLFLCRDLFKKRAGIEITDECRNYSRNYLGQRTEKDVDDIGEKMSVVTFWHSLEHMLEEDINKIMGRLAALCSLEARIIISVPNNGSFQNFLFRSHYPYYDPQSHLQQFSLRSLDLLLDKFNFQKERYFFSFPYILLGYVQGFLNPLNATRNYLYYRFKRGCAFNKDAASLFFLDAYNLILAGALFIPSLLLSAIDCVVPGKEGVLTICYRRKKQ